jgi:hypothetical protein
MQLFKLAAFSAFTGAVLAAPPSLSKRDLFGVFFCTNINWSGTCETVVASGPGACSK